MDILNMIDNGKYLNIEFPYFNYKQDNESQEKEDKYYKDDKDINPNNQGSKANLLNNSNFGSKSINEKSFTKLTKQYLYEEEQKKRYKYNSFLNIYFLAMILVMLL